jgi:SAM-dependent methyltransferase
MRNENSKIRISNIAKVYDNIDAADQFFYCKNIKNMRELISHKQFFSVFSNLNYDFPSKEPAALDIGCSSGRYVAGLLKNGFNAVGVDTAIIPLKYASKRIDGKFIRASATNLPFKRNSFDLITCIELLHHFENEVLDKVLAEISEIMKPQGIFIFDVKNKRNPIIWQRYKKEDRIGFTLKARTIGEMVKYTELHHFKIIKKMSIIFPIMQIAPYIIFWARKEEI